jgi:hypothetical protein
MYGEGGTDGVQGVSTEGTGVHAVSTNGAALLAESVAEAGIGLKVEMGRSMFHTAGTAVVASGQKKVTVDLPGVSPTDFVLATVQGTGAYQVKNAVAGYGQFTIAINKAPTPPNTVTVGYFVISAT